MYGSINTYIENWRLAGGPNSGVYQLIQLWKVEIMAAKATPKKRSTLQIVIEDKYLSELVSGSIWKLTDEEIVSRKETLDKFRKVLGSAYKMYDKELQNLRKIHGDDHLANVTYFRKPRSKKESNDDDLMSELEMDDSDDESSE